MFTPKEIQSLNDLENLVYDFVLKNKYDIPQMRIREVATQAHVSTTTVLRFCKKMGCSGYSEFKTRFKEYQQPHYKSNYAEQLDNVRDFFDSFTQGSLDDALQQALDLIMQCDTIMFYGIGNSLALADYGCRAFSNSGIFSTSIQDPFYPLQIQPPHNAGLVVLSVSGETREIIRMATILRDKNCPIISVCADPNSTLAKISDVCISYAVPMKRGEEYVDYTTQVPVLVILESLSQALAGRLLDEDKYPSGKYERHRQPLASPVPIRHVPETECAKQSDS